MGSDNINRNDRVVVYSGSNGSVLLTVAAASAGKGAGDVDGDGADDVMVNDSRSSLWIPTLYSGATGRPLQFDFEHDSTIGSSYTSADAAGDVNGDGYGDLLLGTGRGVGGAVVFSGVDGTVLHIFTGDAAGDQFGSAVSAVGDVDGDGLPDVAVSANQLASGGYGYVRVFSGADGRVLHALPGDASLPGFGQSLSGAGDVDGDGLADVIVGAGSDDAGWAQVYSGEMARSCTVSPAMRPAMGLARLSAVQGT